ncbi:DHHC palmitoyltransferase-domain-containing protein [Mycena alexandri]|uniref:Palmitoyltransferase n=1 Tax=Mycena alexandri TaxID=1745969 RepID=A0AAD6SR18_9AGAR|nr:DHHC palmitoyltransferase-domain-containing protein [Mycena alexandri]KAJ7032449.1 DHHC palmitoyltransferase-domain-containing protein [Mycena alexandri]
MASTTRQGTTGTTTRSPTSPTHAGGIQPSASFFHPSKPNRRHRSPSVENDGGIYNLSSLSKQISNSEDDHLPRFSAEDSSTRQSSGSGRRGQLSPSRMVRNSVELVFSLRRGMSLEALSPSSSGGRAEEPGMYDTHRKMLGQGDYRSGSPASSFVLVGTPTPAAAPRSAVPLLDPVTHKSLRNYQLHPSRNRFFLRGRLLVGGDSPWAFIASFSLLLGIAGVWLGTTAVWWWRNVSPAVVIVGAYLALIAISTMLATAMRDPGILPRDLDPEPPYPATSLSDGDMRTALPRDLKVKSDVVRVKWCPTCATYRPPRASHCRMCDNCVDGLDHHCRWVNNCVGRRNYTTFFVLLVSLTATALYVIVTAALHLSFLARWTAAAGGDGGGGFKHAVRHGAGSAVVFCLTVLVLWPVGALLSYHVRLLLLDVTTLEQIRNQAHKTLVPGPAPPNPYTHGSWHKNLVAVLCRPVGSSWLDAGGWATQDDREVNPGYRRAGSGVGPTSPGIGKTGG